MCTSGIYSDRGSVYERCVKGVSKVYNRFTKPLQRLSKAHPTISQLLWQFPCSPLTKLVRGAAFCGHGGHGPPGPLSGVPGSCGEWFSSTRSDSGSILRLRGAAVLMFACAPPFPGMDRDAIIASSISSAVGMGHTSDQAAAALERHGIIISARQLRARAAAAGTAFPQRPGIAYHVVVQTTMLVLTNLGDGWGFRKVAATVRNLLPGATVRTVHVKAAMQLLSGRAWQQRAVGPAMRRLRGTLIMPHADLWWQLDLDCKLQGYRHRRLSRHCHCLPHR